MRAQKHISKAKDFINRPGTIADIDATMIVVVWALVLTVICFIISGCSDSPVEGNQIMIGGDAKQVTFNWDSGAVTKGYGEMEYDAVRDILKIEQMTIYNFTHSWVRNYVAAGKQKQTLWLQLRDSSLLEYEFDTIRYYNDLRALAWTVNGGMYNFYYTDTRLLKYNIK